MREQCWNDGMTGLAVGDALGLSVQFMYPHEIRKKHGGLVTGMVGDGTYHMPAGTWSDDASMALASLDSLNRWGSVVPADIMERFTEWYENGAYTQCGFSFDIGATCMKAIENFEEKHDSDTCGVTGEYANGNGALMRILPVCLYAYDRQKTDTRYGDAEAVADVHTAAGLTHNHLRSNMACGLYFFMTREILDCREEKSLAECLQDGITKGLEFYGADEGCRSEMEHYRSVFCLEELKEMPESKVLCSGYVVRSLEAALWCLVKTSSFKEALLRVVNFGYDSDTVGAIAGGLAGLYYGIGEIPAEWLAAIRWRKVIEEMAGGKTWQETAGIRKQKD